jgi:hypothetical protein
VVSVGPRCNLTVVGEAGVPFRRAVTFHTYRGGCTGRPLSRKTTLHHSHQHINTMSSTHQHSHQHISWRHQHITIINTSTQPSTHQHNTVINTSVGINTSQSSTHQHSHQHNVATHQHINTFINTSTQCHRHNVSNASTQCHQHINTVTQSTQVINISHINLHLDGFARLPLSGNRSGQCVP